MYAWLALAFAALTAAVYSLSGSSSAFVDLGTTERLLISSGIAIMVLYACLFLTDFAQSIGQSVRYAFIWLGIVLALITGYTFREELAFVSNRVASELLPAGQGVTVASNQNDSHSVRIRRRQDSHFQAIGQVNGQNVTMLVDTGASTVVLRPSDAKKAGIDIDNLSYTIPVSTANGQAYSARVNLRQISIGPIVFRDIEAMVAKPGSLSQSLLGMSFLRRLRSYEFSKDFLTLRS
ncbi:MAG: retropepsin-like aspartic protease family protein [Hyphomicrobiaceae bacterium]